MQDQAVVNYGPEKYSVELREIPRATIRDDEVLLEVQAVGVCGSDLHMWTAQQSWPMKYPMVLGHEFCGVIREVGRDAKGWKEGDRVVSETAAVIDPNNPLSREGKYNLGADPPRLRVAGRWGDASVCAGADSDFASHAGGPVVRASGAHRAVLRGVQCRGPQRADSAGRSRGRAGAGADRNSGCGDRAVVRSERGGGRFGKRSGAVGRRQAIWLRSRSSATRPSWAQEVDGLGADGVVDATGVSAALDNALDLVRPAGWISKVGWGPQPVGFSLDRLVQKNITLQGSFSHNWPIWERVIRLIASGTLDVRPITGGVWPLSKWQEAFETMHSGKIVKAVLKPEV